MLEERDFNQVSVPSFGLCFAMVATANLFVKLKVENNLIQATRGPALWYSEDL